MYDKLTELSVELGIDKVGRQTLVKCMIVNRSEHAYQLMLLISAKYQLRPVVVILPYWWCSRISDALLWISSIDGPVL